MSLRRTSLVRHTELAHGGSQLTRKTRLRPASKKKRKVRREAQPVVDAVFERDGACILRDHAHLAGRCFGEPKTPHHLRKQSAEPGQWPLDGLVTLCSFHNGDWVERNSDEAHALGLVVRNGESVYDAWARMVRAGLPVAHPILDPCCDLPDGECEHGGAAP